MNWNACILWLNHALWTHWKTVDSFRGNVLTIFRYDIFSIRTSGNLPAPLAFSNEKKKFGNSFSNEKQLLQYLWLRNHFNLLTNRFYQSKQFEQFSNFILENVSKCLLVTLYIVLLFNSTQLWWDCYWSNRYV